MKSWLEKGMTLGMRKHLSVQIAVIRIGRMPWTVDDERFEVGAGYFGVRGAGKGVSTRLCHGGDLRQ